MRYLVTFLLNAKDGNELPHAIMTCDHSAGKVFDWALGPEGLRSSVLIATSKEEAERLVKEVQEGNPAWQAVISKIEEQILPRQKKRSLVMDPVV